jgi:hypothetical protein
MSETKQIEMVQIPVGLQQAMLQYLSQRPLGEVLGLFTNLQNAQAVDQTKPQ